MTRLLAAFALVTTLMGCVMEPYAPSQSLFYTPPPAVELPPPEPVFDPNFDATYETEPQYPSQPVPVYVAPETRTTPPPSGALLARQRAACTSDGGRFMPRGTGLYACVYQTSDGGRQCDEASDCEGVCLARSRTCAPMQPLFGCQEVFTQPGRQETLCTD